MKNLFLILAMALLPALAFGQAAEDSTADAEDDGSYDKVEAARLKKAGVNLDDPMLQRRPDGSLATDDKTPVLKGVKNEHCCLGPIPDGQHNENPDESAAETQRLLRTKPADKAD